MLGKHSAFVLILHPNNILKCSFLYYTNVMLIKHTFKVKARRKENAFPIVELGQWPGKRQAKGRHHLREVNFLRFCYLP